MTTAIWQDNLPRSTILYFDFVRMSNEITITSMVPDSLAFYQVNTGTHNFSLLNSAYISHGLQLPAANASLYCDNIYLTQNITKSQWTYGVIVRVDSVAGGYPRIIADSGDNFGLVTTSTYLAWYTPTGSWNDVTAATYRRGEKMTLFFTADGTTGRLYQNGTLVHSKAQTTPFQKNVRPIYGRNSASGEYINGTIYEIIAMDRCLDAAEIKSLQTTFRVPNPERRSRQRYAAAAAPATRNDNLLLLGVS